MTTWLAALGAAALGVLAGVALGARWVRRQLLPDAEAARSELQRRLDELFALHELTYVLSESLEPNRVAEQVADYLARFASAGGALVALLAERGGSIRIAAASGTLADLADEVVGEDDGELLSASMGGERMELVEQEPGGPAPVLVGGRTVHRAAVVPLSAHGVTLGALAVADAPEPFSTRELRLLSTVATHAAAVLSNARFVELLTRARDEWALTFDALAAGLAVVDGDGRVRRANRALAALAGQPAEQLLRQHLAAGLLRGADDVLTMLDAVRRSGRPDTRIHDTGRRGHILRVSAAPMHEHGASAWLVLLIEDVTEQKLLEGQLIQNEKMAAVGQLVSGVAHELNNPLTSIAGLAEFLLERAGLADRDREHLRVMREQAERASRIVRNLLTFARKGPAEVSELDLNDIVQRTVALVSYEVRLREATLDTALDPDLPRLRGDRYQIQQVVVNLVTNALRAVQDNPPGAPRTIRISTARQQGDVVLDVADSGPGVPDADATEIFTPFFTTKPPGEGTGLGLAIAFRIVQGHEGQLTVRDGPDGGAVFSLRLPVDTELAARRPTPHVAAGEVSGLDRARRGRILLVDNDPAVRKMITVLLGSDRHTVDAVEDAGVAAERLDTEAFDLVIADPRAAVSAGERLGDHLLRRWPELRTRTIFLTADVRPETETWLRALGSAYLFKPFRVAELKGLAAELLGRGAQA